MPKLDQIPACPSLPARRSSGLVTRDYAIRLITPMFGGGVVAGEPDQSFPIRGTSIRGQLQFWWRATRGAVCATHDDLFKRHGEVWGTTKKASPVELEVRDIHCDPPRPCAQYTWNPRARGGRGGWSLHWDETLRDGNLPYALFPFQGERPPIPSPEAAPKKVPSQFIAEGSFVLRLRFPAGLQEEVDAAVWAWGNLGGIGSRTRRGCGALLCEELAPEVPTDLTNWLRQWAGDHELNQRQWPTVSTTFLYCNRMEQPVQAWDCAIERLNYFRQGVGFARDPGNPPSRSRYPEPDTIRRITGASSRGHQPRSTTPDGFPRAEFGLPIIFHFKDEKGGDPFETVLYPFIPEMTSDGPKVNSDGIPVGDVKDRMASPVVIKPLALRNGKAVPMIMFLNTRPITTVELQRNARNKECLTPTRAVPVRDPGLASGNSPIAGRTTSGSVLEAFRSFMLNESGFQEA